MADPKHPKFGGVVLNNHIDTYAFNIGNSKQKTVQQQIWNANTFLVI